MSTNHRNVYQRIGVVFAMGLSTCALTFLLFSAVDRNLTSAASSFREPLKVIDSNRPELIGTVLERPQNGYQLPSGQHRLELPSNSLSDFELLSIEPITLASVQLKTSNSQGEQIQTIARETPLTERPFYGPGIVFEINEGRLSTERIEVEIKADRSQTLQLFAWPQINDFRHAQFVHNRIIGIYFGTAAVLFTLSLVAYFATRRVAYGYYATFLGFHAVTILAYEGIHLGNDLAKLAWLYPLLLASIPLTVIYALKFLERFLELRENHPGLQRFLLGFRRVFYLLLVVQLGLLPFPDAWAVGIKTQHLLVLVAAGIYPIVAGLVAIQGKREHQLIFVTFIPHFIAVGLYLFQTLGWSAPDPNIYYKLLGSTFVEMLLISAALGLHMHSMRQAKDSADETSFFNLKRAIKAEEAFRTDLETQVEKRTEQLSRSDAEKRHLLEIISHDLRAPLHSVHEYGRLVLEDDEGYQAEDYREAINELNLSTRQLYDLLENLLTWTKTSWEEVVPEKDFVDVDLLVRQVLDLYRSTLRAKQIKVSLEIKKDGSVFADPDMLNTLLRNVISNALRHSPANGTLSITSQSIPDGPTSFRILSGPLRINEAFAERITKGTETRASQFSSGMGLRLCREMAERNGWNFEIRPVSAGTLVSFEVEPTNTPQPILNSKGA